MTSDQKTSSSTAVKNPYQQPHLECFGQLHLLTQGTGSANGDGGQNMKTKMT